jgi:hypothetical protein
MTRSVLIYVDDKRGSFAALHRVLRPGGRLSTVERETLVQRLQEQFSRGSAGRRFATAYLTAIR